MFFWLAVYTVWGDDQLLETADFWHLALGDEWGWHRQRWLYFVFYRNKITIHTQIFCEF